jgi:2-ketoarginine methyltransferase
MLSGKHVITEEGLTTALQPIRQFVLAQALYHFMNMGIQDRLAGATTLTIHDLSEDLNLNENRLGGFLAYLANEGFVELLTKGGVRLTAVGSTISAFQPWYTLLVGGYAQTFIELPKVLGRDGRYADRNSSQVGLGSCGISQYDALPMTRSLLDKIEGSWRTVVDLGCGDGSYLLDLCRSLPGVRGIGLDPDLDSVTTALRTAEKYGIADRVDIRVGSIPELPDLAGEMGPFCFITAFVLQVLEQSGRSAIVELLKRCFGRYPDACWIVIEVDHRPDDPSVMSRGLGLAYYNPYYLIHQLTQQKLERVAFWQEVFRESGLRVLAVEHPDPTYDSLALKVGFLLARDDSVFGRDQYAGHQAGSATGGA